MTDKYQILEHTLNQMIGQSCWAVMVSGGLDNAITLSFGDKLARKVPLESPHLPDVQRKFYGAYELAVADCTWRLDSTGSIVTSWSDDEAPKREALNYLLATPITQWEITWPGLDLTVHFKNQLALRLFCDQTSLEDGGENYALLSPSYIFQVGVRSTLTLQPKP